MQNDNARHDRSQSRRSRLLTLAGVGAGAAVVLAAAGGIAYATIPATDGTITACYTKSGSSLRVIDAASTSCKSGETLLTWNTQGPAGTPGADGAPGADGVSGYELVYKPIQVGVGSGQSGVDCPAGKVALGGGAYPVYEGNPVGSSQVDITSTGPAPDGSGWVASWETTGSLFVDEIRIYATCATAN